MSSVQNKYIWDVLYCCSHAGQRDKIVLTVDSTGCMDQPSNKVVYLEHVHVVLDLGASKRGELEVRAAFYFRCLFYHKCNVASIFQCL